MLAHSFNPNPQEAETDLCELGQHDLHSKFQQQDYVVRPCLESKQ